jgi:hypothetical protein
MESRTYAFLFVTEVFINQFLEPILWRRAIFSYNIELLDVGPYFSLMETLMVIFS